MKILMVRHAKAWDRQQWADQGKPNRARPLLEEGISEFSAIAAQLAAAVKAKDVSQILTSPTTRTQQTADVLAEAFSNVPVLDDDALLQGTSIDKVQAMIVNHAKPGKITIMVGHENHFSQILSHLLTASDASSLQFKKGGAALIAIKESGGIISGQLRWMATPKLLRSLRPA